MSSAPSITYSFFTTPILSVIQKRAVRDHIICTLPNLPEYTESLSVTLNSDHKTQRWVSHTAGGIVTYYRLPKRILRRL